MGARQDMTETILESKRRNRIAVAAGAVTTLLATVFLFFLPAIVPVDHAKIVVFETTGNWISGDPFRQLRLLGPVPGGFVAGYLSLDRTGYPDRVVSMKTGAIAAVAGVGGIYLVTAASIAIRYWTVVASRPDLSFTLGHLLDTLLVPLGLVLPLVPVALFEGVCAGIIGNWLRRMAPAGSAITV
jgi:hypothetical protein